MKAKLKPPTWASVITAAEKRGKFTDAEMEQSGCWATCAVGEKVSTRTETFNLALRQPELWERPTLSLLVRQCHRVSQFIDTGGALYVAGMAFMYAVQNNEFDFARRALRRVQRNFRPRAK